MRFLIVFLFSLIGITGWAAPICFTDQASYEAVKSKLPPSMQQGRLSLGIDSNSLVAAVQILPTKSGFQFRMAYNHWLIGSNEESGAIKKICVEGKQAIVTLASGSSKKLEIRKNGFAYEGNVLTPVSSSQFNNLMKTIKNTKPGKSKRGSGTSGQG